MLGECVNFEMKMALNVFMSVKLHISTGYYISRTGTIIMKNTIKIIRKRHSKFYQANIFAHRNKLYQLTMMVEV